MNTIETLQVQDYLHQNEERVSEAITELLVQPMTYQQKVKLVQKLVKEAIQYGIEKGSSLEHYRVEEVKKLNRKRAEARVDEWINELNESIVEYNEQPKVRYSKRRYRAKKHGVYPFHLIPKGMEQRDCLVLTPKHLTIW